MFSITVPKTFVLHCRCLDSGATRIQAKLAALNLGMAPLSPDQARHVAQAQALAYLLVVYWQPAVKSRGSGVGACLT